MSDMRIVTEDTSINQWHEDCHWGHWGLGTGGSVGWEGRTVSASLYQEQGGGRMLGEPRGGCNSASIQAPSHSYTVRLSPIRRGRGRSRRRSRSLYPPPLLPLLLLPVSPPEVSVRGPHPPPQGDRHSLPPISHLISFQILLSSLSSVMSVITL